MISLQLKFSGLLVGIWYSWILYEARPLPFRPPPPRSVLRSLRSR